MTIDEWIEMKLKVVLEFMAPWSEPCKFMRPAMEEIAARFKEHADFYTLDVEQFKVLASSLHWGNRIESSW